jgi:hypothetical protein
MHDKRSTHSRWIVVAKVAWFGLCSAALIFKPWEGGDGGISFFFVLVYITLPLGIFSAFLMSLITDLSLGTTYENLLCRTDIWWISYLVLQTLVGYLQWFVLIPFIIRKIGSRGEKNKTKLS